MHAQWIKTHASAMIDVLYTQIEPTTPRRARTQRALAFECPLLAPLALAEPANAPTPSTASFEPGMSTCRFELAGTAVPLITTSVAVATPCGGIGFSGLSSATRALTGQGGSLQAVATSGPSTQAQLRIQLAAIHFWDMGGDLRT